MGKRKRYSNELVTDVGLGATLARMRDDEQADNHPPVAVANNDDDGWITVGAPKKKRKQQELNHEPEQPQAENEELNGRSEEPIPQSEPLLSATAGEQAPAPTNPFSSKVRGDKVRTDNNSERFPARSPSTERKQAKAERKKERKLERNYPSIEHSHHARLQSHVKISDLQSLALYILADGNAPQWVSVRHRNSIRHVMVLMVPGLELGMFNGDIALESSGTDRAADPPSSTNASPPRPKRLHVSPDDFYPASLKPHRLPSALKPLADIFPHVWPVKGIGEHRAHQYYKVHSPIHTMLTSQIPRSHEERQMKKNTKGPLPQNTKFWDNKRTPITTYIATLVEQQENEFVTHPAWFTTPEAQEAAYQRRKEAQQTLDDGWVDTNVTSLADGEVPENEVEQGSVTAGRKVLTVDCEMCKSEEDKLVLTRVSLLDWDGNVVLDKLVKPDVPIKDYLTQCVCLTNMARTTLTIP